MGVTRVLICDDHAVVRAGLRLILETRPGFVLVGEATNGQEVLAQARQTQPDLVILRSEPAGLDRPGGDPRLAASGAERQGAGAHGSRRRGVFLYRLASRRGRVYAERRVGERIGRRARLGRPGRRADPRILGQRLAGDHLGRAADTADLSDREQEMLRLIAAGSSNNGSRRGCR